MTPESSIPGEPGDPLQLPEPCLVVLVGVAGSGKSTLATRHFEADEVLSSDAYRALVSGDPADQSVTRVAFSLLHRELERRMAAGRTTVVDATNVTSYARRSLVRRAAAHGRRSVAIVLDLNADLVRARNATRAGRIVPEDAVRRQLADLGRSLRRESFEAEGFAAILYLRTAEAVDRLEVRRGIRPSRPR